MSPHPLPAGSGSLSSPSPTATPTGQRIAGGPLHVVIIVLSILAAFLVTYVIYLAIGVKRRRMNGEHSGPYQGTVIHSAHPAAQIIPFGHGSQPGAQGPIFKRSPGEDMRIAIRQPDGAWHFADSRTPFQPSGVNDLENVPSPISPSYASIFSFPSSKPSSRKTVEVKLDSFHRRFDPDMDFEPNPTVAPPPAYHPEARQHHADDYPSPI